MKDASPLLRMRWDRLCEEIEECHALLADLVRHDKLYGDRVMIGLISRKMYGSKEAYFYATGKDLAQHEQ